MIRQTSPHIEKNDLKAIIAPELEFYLCEKNLDPNIPLQTPVGKSGRRANGSDVFGIDSVNEFDVFFIFIRNMMEYAYNNKEFRHTLIKTKEGN